MILNDKMYSTGSYGEMNLGDTAPRMSMDIGECLLDDSKDGGLQILWETAQLFRKIQIDLDIAPLHESLHIPVNRKQQSHFVQHGWVQ